MHEGGGRWVGSNKLVELKKKKKSGRRLQETVLQRRYTHGQQAHEKTGNTANYQRDSSENFNELSSHTGLSLGHYQKDYK